MKTKGTTQKFSIIALVLLLLTAVFAANGINTKVRADEPVTPVTPPIVTIAPTTQPSSNAVLTSSSGSGGSTNTTGTPTCDNTKPGSPNLFQVKTTRNSATLYFTPANGNPTYYMTAFGFNYLDERFGAQFPLNNPNKGVQSITVGHLEPNKTYYFRVRGGDGCMPGEWSNTLIVTTNSKTYYLYK